MAAKRARTVALVKCIWDECKQGCLPLLFGLTFDVKDVLLIECYVFSGF